MSTLTLNNQKVTDSVRYLLEVYENYLSLCSNMKTYIPTFTEIFEEYAVNVMSSVYSKNVDFIFDPDLSKETVSVEYGHSLEKLEGLKRHEVFEILVRYNILFEHEGVLYNVPIQSCY